MATALRQQPFSHAHAKPLRLDERPSLRAGEPRKVNELRASARSVEREVLTELLERCRVNDQQLAADVGNPKAERFGAQLRAGSLHLTVGEAVLLPSSIRFAIGVAMGICRKRLQRALTEPSLSPHEATQVRLVLAYLDSIESLLSAL